MRSTSSGPPGKGVAGLQEAGIIGVQPWAWVPRIEVLGLFPTMQTVLAQAIAVAILVIGFWWNGRGNAEGSEANSDTGSQVDRSAAMAVMLQLMKRKQERAAASS